MRCSGSSNIPQKSGNLAVSFNCDKGSKNGSELEKIEAEYIKNLQQQIYFLELEANYLREQARKAAEMQPKMTAEAEAMILKLQSMQSAVDEQMLEVHRLEAGTEILKKEKNRLASKLKAEEEAHQRDKRLHVEEVSQLKKQIDLADKDASRKDAQLAHSQEELSQTMASVRTSKTSIQMLQNEIDQKADQLHVATTALDEKRAELLRTQSKLNEMENRYYGSMSSMQDRLVTDLREEVKSLREKLKECELSTNQDRYLRSKLSEDSGLLVKENAALLQQASEMRKQLEQEKAMRESNSTRLSQNMSEMMVLRDREKQLQFELTKTKDELEREHNRLTLLMTQVADKDKEVSSLKKQVLDQQTRVRELEHVKDMECSLHSQKWQEFSRLADSMKSLSHNMANSCTSSSRPTLN